MIPIARVIDAVIQLRDQFSATLKNVNGNLSQFQRQATYAGANMIKVGKDMGAVGKTLSMTVTAPIVAAGAGLLKLADDFQAAQNTIRTTTGATGKTLAGLNDDFKAVYSQVSASMADTSQVVAQLNSRTGLAGKPLEDLSTQMLKLAKITGSDINTLIPATTRMFQDAGIAQADYSKALDYTFKVHEQTGISVDRLQELMTQFGGPLRQMGFDWQTSGAMLGKFEKEGVNTELVVGSLRIALGKMAKEGIKDPSQALQTMITQIKAAGSAGQANALALKMFGAKAGPDMAAAIREGRMDLTGLLQTLKNSPDTISKAAADAATWAGKLAKMRHVIEVAFGPVSEKLKGSLDNLMPSFQKLVDTVAGFAQKLADMSPAQQEMIIKFATMAAVVGPVIFTVGKVVTSIGNAITPFTKLAKSISNAGGIMAYLAGPGGIVMLVIAALVALVAIGILVYTHWDQIKKKAKELHDEFIKLKDKAINEVKNTFQNLMDKVQEVKDKLIDFKDKAVGVVKQEFEDFTQSLKDHQKAIENTAIVLGTIFGPALIKTGVKAAISGGQILGNFIANVIKTGTESVIAAAKITANFIASMAKAGLEAVINAAKITGSFIVSLIRSGTESVIAGAKITVSFIGSLIKVAAQAIITGAVITISLIGSLIAYAAQGWTTVAAISAQTLAWLAQKGMMLVSAAVTGIMTAAQWALNAAMDANPIGAVILLVMGLIAAGVLLYQNWDTVKQTLSDAWVNIKNSFIDGVNYCIGLIDEFINGLNKIPGVNIPLLAKISLDVSKNSTAEGMRSGRNALGTTYWSGGRTLVGEHGAEEIDLPKGTKIKDAQSTRNSGGSITVAKLADTIIVREDADIDKIANALVLKLHAVAINTA
ncbi:phage tail tape measure protein [Desulfosporosinus sp. SB140]|uniref:phage tail tape measure protein n=1 Tax=Desulfosporosinus paludis TaxID=3115649 RepID=UPI00388F0B65